MLYEGQGHKSHGNIRSMTAGSHIAWVTVRTCSF